MSWKAKVEDEFLEKDLDFSSPESRVSPTPLGVACPSGLGLPAGRAGAAGGEGQVWPLPSSPVLVSLPVLLLAVHKSYVPCLVLMCS